LLSTGFVIAGIPYFLYVEAASITKKVMTMALLRSMNVEPEIVNNTKCDMNYACLLGKAVCDVEPFVDREVQLLRCKDERSCAFKKKYQGRIICTCPVNMASLNLN
jgi:hypothetical protein